MAKKATVAKKPAKTAKTRIVDSTSGYDRWIIWLTYAILVLLPTVFSRISYDQFDLVKLAIFRVLVAVMTFLWLAKMLSKRQSVSWSWREALLLGFLVVGVVSALTSIHIPTSLHGKYKRYEGLLTFIAYLTVYFVAMQTFRQKKHVRTVLEIISITGAVVGFYGILQYTGHDPVYWGALPFEEKRAFSSFGNPDLLAGYLVLAFSCSIVLFLDRALKRRWLHGSTAFILFISLLTALTRSGWLGGIAGILTIAVLLGRKLIQYRRQFAVAFVLIAVITTVIVIEGQSRPNNVINKLAGAFELNGGTALGRFEIWKAGLAMVADRPLFGQGLDTYRLASERFETKRYVRSVTGTTVSDNAHNYPIQIAAGGGVPAVIFFYGFFIAWIVRMVRARRDLEDESERLMVIGATASVIGYLTTMMLGISIVGASSTFWIIMGAFSGYLRNSALRYRSFDLVAMSKELKLVVALVLMIFTLLNAGIASAMYLGDIYLVRGLMAVAGGQPNGPGYFYQASALYPGNGRIMSELGQTYLRWAGSAMSQGRNEDFSVFVNKGIESFEKARDAEPLEADYKVFLANAHSFLGHYDEAMKILQEVIDRRPYSLPAHFLMGQYARELNRPDEAIVHLQQAFEIAPNYQNLASGLRDLYREKGDAVRASYYEQFIPTSTPQ